VPGRVDVLAPIYKLVISCPTDHETAGALNLAASTIHDCIPGLLHFCEFHPLGESAL
jgi:hypothetical protein